MTLKVNARQLQCAALLESYGASPSGAAGLGGNFCQESGPTLPTAFRTGRLDHGSQGLAQWRLGRLDDYEDMVRAKHPGLDDEEDLWPWYGRLDYQCEFVMHELEHSYPTLHKKIVEGGDVASLAADVCWQYERPNKALSGIANRIAWARAIAEAMPSKHEAKEPDITTSLMATAEAHQTQANAGSAMAGAGVVGVAGFGAFHMLPHLATWEIVCLGILAVTIVIGIINMTISGSQAAAVKAAMPNVDNTAPRGGHKDPIVAASPQVTASSTQTAPTPVDKSARRKANAAAAAAGEHDAIDKAFGAKDVLPPKGLVPTPAPTGAVTVTPTPGTPVPAAAPTPIMSVTDASGAPISK